MALPLEARREILRRQILSKLEEPTRESPELDARLSDLIQSVKARGLRGWLPSAVTAGMNLGSALVLGRKCA